jgi:PDZ domain-containing protein
VLPLLVAVLTLAVVLNTDLPYYALAPGSANEVDELIRAPEDRLHPARGEVYLATVSLQRVKPLGALRGWLDGTTDVVPEKRILGTTPPAQYRQQNLQLMDDSKQTAIVVALRQLGYDVPEQGKGALVVEVSAGSPAADRLRPGDTITAIDGTPTTLVNEAVARIQARKPGDVARLEVSDADGVARVEVVTLAENTDNERRRGQAFLGVLMRTKDRTFPMPFDVTIDSGRIGGPSAGLAFTLALIEQLAPAELTGGHKVAVTGTIDIDGAVGEVGGVAQKTAAVRSEGAEYFFVPPGEFEVAKRHAGKRLKVVPVATLQEAIDALARIGGDVTGASKDLRR